MASKKANVPDILIGMALVLILPLLAFALSGGSSEPPRASANGKIEPLLTLQEAQEKRDEYARMYSQNAQIFIQRASAHPDHQAQELGWAKNVLEKARKGLTTLKEEITGGKAAEDVAEILPQIDELLRKIDGSMKAVQ